MFAPPDSLDQVMRLFKFLLGAALALSMFSCGGAGNHPAMPPPRIDTHECSTGNIQDYNQTLETLLSTVLLEYKPNQMTGTLVCHGTKIRFEGGHNQMAMLNPTMFDDIQIIKKPEGGDQVKNLVRRDGLGVPVVMMQKFRKDKSSLTKLFPLNGRHLPATLVAEPDDNGVLVFKFHHTRNVQNIAFHGKYHDLAYDLSTPLSRSMRGSLNGNMALNGLVDSDRYLGDTGIYVPDVYDPGKIPVVFVHGLKSDPHIWQNAMNEVLRDPELRKKYQCWYFLYPTGLPIYASAAKLRHMLNLARDHYDPGHGNAQMNQIVLVGHSMGGIISRMQTIDSGMDIYDSCFVKPLAQLPVEPLTKNLIRESMIFKRVPFVKRVIFVATPHQGSSVAQIPIVNLASLLVHPTRALDAVTLDIRLHAKDSVNPKLLTFRNFGACSTLTLSPDHPLLAAMQKRTIQVPYHSVIAAQHFDTDPTNTSDGIVAYWSSHISGAQSEKIVAGNHGCIRLPAVSEEILRILRLHCDTSAMAKRATHHLSLE